MKQVSLYFLLVGHCCLLTYYIALRGYRAIGTCEGPLSGVESRRLADSSGSVAGLRELDLDSVDLPVELPRRSADDRVHHVQPGTAVGEELG